MTKTIERTSSPKATESKQKSARKTNRKSTEICAGENAQTNTDGTQIPINGTKKASHRENKTRRLANPVKKLQTDYESNASTSENLPATSPDNTARSIETSRATSACGNFPSGTDTATEDAKSHKALRSA